MINKRTGLYEKYSADRLAKSYNNFRLFRSRVHKAINKQKQIYNNIFENCLNDKSFFRNLNSVAGRLHKYSVKKIVVQGKEFTQSADIAEQFNQHFVYIGEKINNSIAPTNTNSIQEDVIFSMYLEPVTTAEIHNIIMGLKSHRSMGPDGIPSEVLKHCLAVLSKHLANLINESFSEGCFPNCLKLANVVPVYKSDEKTDMSNYRPISLLSVVSKVFEKAMYTRIVSFLHQFKLLGDFQFGFRDKRSSTDAISHIIVKIRMHHSVEMLCLKPEALLWLKSYLEGRSQFVTVNEITS